MAYYVLIRMYYHKSYDNYVDRRLQIHFGFFDFKIKKAA